MSNNPQWKSFQSSSLASDSAILDFKSYSNITAPGHNSTPKSYRNGAFSDTTKQYFSYPTSSSPPLCSSGVGGTSGRFPTIGTFSLDNPSGVVGGNGTPQNQSTSFNSSGDSGTVGLFSATNNSQASSGGGNVNNTSFGSSGAGSNSDSANQGTRETGIIEKLLHSYGFIQCCERQARLFFHFSQFSGNIEHLKIGDPVEFEMTYDRRTGKPIASTVSKIAPEVVLSEERVTGNVTTELRTEGSGDTQGRISYENRGECFFLPYTKDDVEGNVTLRSGDKVSFQIATNQRGNLGACHVRLENPAHPVLYRGVVCSMKESFGFIERADVVKEIFFHFSEAKTTEELRPGDDVEFIILTRNGKEVACNIVRLPPGTVVFEDVDPDITKGQVLKPLDRGTGQRHQSDPLPGRIRYRAPDHSEVEVPFGDKDQKGDFTLRHGDWVQFQLATDRRDQLRRATSISLLDESFVVSGERRDQGVVVALKDGFGFLRCAEREPRLFFHFMEVLDVTREISMGDEVEFTAVQDPNSSFANLRHSAIRIKHLPPGTVKFETLVESNLTGVVTREASPRSPSKTQNGSSQQNGGPPVPEGGMISYQSNGQKKSVPFFAKDCDRQPRIGDKVEFNISQVKRNKELIATDVVVTAISNQSSNHSFNGSSVSSTSSSNSQSSSMRNGISKNGRQSLSNGQLCQGFVAALKDGFGFIETIAHDKEVFFHFSNFEGDTATLDLGQEVEYILAPRGSNGGSGSGSCCSAENVRTITRGSIPLPEGTGPLLNGTVTRPLRSVNPDQNEYSGLIQVVSENGDKESYEFGITGLSNKRDLLQNGDPVTLRIDTEGRATEVTALRKKRRATVDAIKGLFGFLAYEVEEGKKLFFHMSEVEDGVQLQQGDTVEFALITNQRSGKSSACNVVKVTDVQARPERLISRLRVSSLEETGPRLTVARQPKGPDGSKGFVSSARQPRQPGVIAE